MINLLYFVMAYYVFTLALQVLSAIYMFVYGKIMGVSGEEVVNILREIKKRVGLFTMRRKLGKFGKKLCNIMQRMIAPFLTMIQSVMTIQEINRFATAKSEAG